MHAKEYPHGPKRDASILVVDDSRVNRELLRSFLSSAGYHVMMASNGREAVEMALEHRPSLILMDVVMPEMDGVVACRHIKAHPSLRTIPIIFVSAQSHAEDKVRGLEAGGDDYLEKGASKAEVLARVRTHLRVKRLLDELQAMNRQLQERNRQLEMDLEAAAGIQKALIPQQALKSERMQAAWAFYPCSKVGGDIFNIFRLDERHAAAYILDVSGHGVPAALMAVSISQMLQPITGTILKTPLPTAPYYRLTPPGELMEKLDTQGPVPQDAAGDPALASPQEVIKILDQEYPIERFGKHFSIVYVLLDTHSGSLRYCNAGHPHPFLLRGKTIAARLDQGGPIIGLGGLMPFEEGRMRLLPGDRIILYTDGVIEQPNPEGDPYGEARLRRILERSAQLSPQGLVDALVEDLQAFSKSEAPRDDVSIVCLEYGGDATSQGTWHLSRRVHQDL
ncbi:Serine phosphatase RsbU, regulator of sigma subunit [Desulfacinum hydrothermale DSM 13146]|uniref:Serine phosphatase RsbU, regulator of sigma subunit n=1 Tax=Desulfacinum hydrothermale DSM 13146 TaxID=1121390 RepID=A0A1W1X9C0_9BACT|nr:SpoIIE family protein phosphatase [Desulfacinum hydrothermale]SMC20111.1 Serine phosphatase RsbU, regulator of sigma subunit [Desulfacinum hydrothermale DSM 13146]